MTGLPRTRCPATPTSGRGFISADDREGLEEERRLCYVGMTRAKNLLTLSYSHNRRIFGASTPMRQSMFLQEIPRDLLDQAASLLPGEPPEGGGAGPRRSLRSTASTWSQGIRPKWEPKPASAPTEVKPSPTLPTALPDFLRPGRSVRHRTFGLGRVVRTEGAEPSLKVTVDFQIAGMKTVVQKFAKLEPA